jgi:ferric-dicitrate binding protein FerR (iron transport regulator)
MNRQILEEASAWFIEFRAGSQSATSHTEFVHWLTRSPEHIRAYLEISGTYTQLPKPGAIPEDAVSALLNRARARVQDAVTPLSELTSTMLPAAGGRAAEQLPRTVEMRRPTLWRVWTLAATILVAIGAGAAWFHAQRGLYTTDTAEQRTVTLEDGSRIELNARSRLRVTYSKTVRTVDLYDGQALFQVAKDTLRPFLVKSGEATVRAVGTQFDVYRKDDHTTVTVLEGRVAVYAPELRAGARDLTMPGAQTEASGSHAALQHDLPRPLPKDSSSTPSVSGSPPGDSSSHALPRNGSGAAAEVPTPAASNAALDPSGSAAIFLSAGEQVTVEPDAITSPHRANVSATTAWTRGQLEFEETPLSEVADEFNRLSTRTLSIDSPALNDLRISGVYSSVDPASLILFLRSQPDLVVTETGNRIEVQAKKR